MAVSTLSRSELTLCHPLVLRMRQGDVWIVEGARITPAMPPARHFWVERAGEIRRVRRGAHAGRLLCQCLDDMIPSGIPNQAPVNPDA